LCVVCLLRAELPRPRRQLHPGQSGRHADAYRAGMVLPAILRDPARDSEQAGGRGRDVWLHFHPLFPAVARHVAREIRDLPASLQAVLLGLRTGVPRAWLSRLAARRRRLRNRGAHPHRLLLYSLPDHLPAAWTDRDAAATAE